MMVDHEFGSVSTDLKLSLVEGYLKAFTTALQGKYKLWYIDAFAGTGERVVRHPGREDILDGAVEERVERRRGSARIAVDVQPQFDRLVFLEKKASHCTALRALKDQHPSRQITIVEENANTAIQREIHWDGWSRTRAVMFLDPYGMDVEWKTLEAIASTKAIDVWYLVSLAGLWRQAALDSDALDDHKRAALTRMLGTDAWQKEWYTQDIQTDMFGQVVAPSRHAKPTDMEQFIGKRLATVFPLVLPPRQLRNERNIPMFSLFFASSNPDPRAMGLSQKIAGHILNAGISSQVRSL